MDNLDGKWLNGSKQWRCDKNPDHILGVIERAQVSVMMDDQSTLKYYTARLLLFRETVDLSAERPAEVDVAGTLDGKLLSMTWSCSVPGCGCIKEWHPDEGALEWLKMRNGRRPSATPLPSASPQIDPSTALRSAQDDLGGEEGGA